MKPIRRKPVTADQLRAKVSAAERMDWQQVVLNGGPPCFHLEQDDSKFCGCAERWHSPDTHKFVPFAELLIMVSDQQVTAKVLRKIVKMLNLRSGCAHCTTDLIKLQNWLRAQAKGKG